MFFRPFLHFRHVSSPPFLCSIFKHQLVLMADDLWFSRNLDKIQLLFCKMEHSFFFLSRCKCNSRKGFQLFDSCHNAAGTFPHIQARNGSSGHISGIFHGKGNRNTIFFFCYGNITAGKRCVGSSFSEGMQRLACHITVRRGNGSPIIVAYRDMSHVAWHRNRKTAGRIAASIEKLSNCPASHRSRVECI